MIAHVRSRRAHLLALAMLAGCGYGSGAVVNGTGSGGASAHGSGGARATGGSNGTGGTTDSTGAGGATNATGGSGEAIDAGAGGASTGGSTGRGGSTGASGGAGGSAPTGSGGKSATGGATGAGGSVSDGWGTPVSGGPTGSGVTATVTISPNTTVGNIGPAFVGFSYEKTHMTNDSITSTNTKLVALYKLLGTPSIRIGANDVDLTTWAGTGAAPTQPSGQPFAKTVNTGEVDQLCSFLTATGSKVIYGVNYKAANVSASAAEAAYIMGKCGSSVYGFEIGNEIDKYGGWSSLQSQWESFADAIVATPGALLIGPAAAGGDSSSLSVPFAKSESAKYGNKLVLLTQHYYVAGSGTTSATAAALQTIKADIATVSNTMNGAAVQYKIRDGYRFGECNSFYGHGQMGVSDALISGLWVLDLMFVNAQNGSSGVNLHGGETGMDGTKPFYYEPIMESQGLVTGVQPVYYGMLLFTLAGTGPMVSTAVTTSNPNFTAYAIKASGFTGIVLVNKNATSGVNATVNVGAPVSSASAVYLQGSPAGSLSAAASSVTLAGAPVTTSGTWNRNPPYAQTVSGNTVSIYVPAATAAVVRAFP
ncbi:MAG: hypothetical protein ABUS79_28530 [Pseudomonadota bacterium]